MMMMMMMMMTIKPRGLQEERPGPCLFFWGLEAWLLWGLGSALALAWI